MRFFYLESPLGTLKAEFKKQELKALTFIDAGVEERPQLSPEALELQTQLTEYFKGERRSFDIRMSPPGTPFQQEVWNMLKEIDYNTTWSYQHMAERYGKPKAIRAIASANAANPIAILIPCHRVIGSDGSLTGYAGGLWRKEYLLDLERGVKRIFDH